MENRIAAGLKNAANAFVKAALGAGFFEEEDFAFYQNRVMELLNINEPGEGEDGLPLAKAREALLEWAGEARLFEEGQEDRDRFSDRLMGLVMMNPGELRAHFAGLQAQAGAQAATDWFYEYCRRADYIKVDRIAQNEGFPAQTPAGTLEITINLSKPEKDPRDIARARTQKSAGYPKCMLCRENPGYAGRPGYPSRQNHRVIPLQLGGEPWYLQYSPYLYYEEHCIVFNGLHTPMAMNEASFRKMFDFVDAFPHYMVGSNADLPIVGGSILTHDHFQGGRHVFPMEGAGTLFQVNTGVQGLEARALTWPISCLKLSSAEREKLLAAASLVLKGWRAYSDEGLMVFSQTEGQPHNAVTPVLRRENGLYHMYLMLRNNLTTAEHPLGLYHPHLDKHHIKKENIGLIEAMGLFILPGRLKTELAEVAGFLSGQSPLKEESPHRDFARALQTPSPLPFEEARARVYRAVGDKCYGVLQDAGVFKQDEAGLQGFKRFVKALGWELL